MKKYINIFKVMIILIVFINTFFMLTITSFASDDSGGFLSEILGLGKNFLNTGEKEYQTDKPLDENALKVSSDYIYNVLLAIGIIAALIVGTIIGIKIIVGTVEEKAKIKEALVPYIIGCIVVFSAFAIWKQVINIGNALEDEVIEQKLEIK